MAWPVRRSRFGGFEAVDDFRLQHYGRTSMVVTAPRPAQKHLSHLDGLRALAALMVFTNHAFAQVWTPGTIPFPQDAFGIFAYSLVSGHLSVTVFIVISGFCLALPVVANGTDRVSGGTRRFLERRALRILPPYYAAVLLSLGLIWTLIGQPTGSLWDVPIQVTWVSIVSHGLLLQDFFATGSINYVFWSIAIEWQIYFLFPLLLLAWRRIGPVATVGIALAAGYALASLSPRIGRANPHFLGMFALGVLGAYVARSARADYARARRLPWGVFALVGLAIASGLTYVWGVQRATTRFHALDLPVGLMAMSLLVASTRSDDNLLRRVLSWKPLVVIGAFSYSVYLIHAPLLQLIWQYLLRPLGFSYRSMFVFLMTGGLMLVLGAAYLFYRLVEAPFMRTARRHRAEPVITPAT